MFSLLPSGTNFSSNLVLESICFSLPSLPGCWSKLSLVLTWTLDCKTKNWLRSTLHTSAVSGLFSDSEPPYHLKDPAGTPVTPLGSFHPLSTLPGIFLSLPLPPTILLLFVLQVLAQTSSGPFFDPRWGHVPCGAPCFLPPKPDSVCDDSLTLGHYLISVSLPRDPKIHKHKDYVTLLTFVSTLNDTGPGPSQELSKYSLLSNVNPPEREVWTYSPCSWLPFSTHHNTPSSHTDDFLMVPPPCPQDTRLSTSSWLPR